MIITKKVFFQKLLSTSTGFSSKRILIKIKGLDALLFFYNLRVLIGHQAP